MNRKYQSCPQGACNLMRSRESCNGDKWDRKLPRAEEIRVRSWRRWRGGGVPNVRGIPRQRRAVGFSDICHVRPWAASVQTQILSPSFRNPAQGLWSKASESCREDSKEPWTRSPRALGDKFSFASLKHLLESHRASVFILCKMVPITITWGPSLVAQW